MIKKLARFIILSSIFLSNPVYSQADGADYMNPYLDERYEKTEEEINNFNKMVVEHNDWAFKHRKKLHEAQYIKSIIIFALVIVVVFTGLYFSFIQFKNSVSKDIKPSDLESETKLKISVNSVEITSSIIGLLILIISLAFLYLYLKEVYPIKILPSNIEPYPLNIWENGK